MSRHLSAKKTVSPELTIRLLQESDFPIADQVFRLAFAAQHGCSEPEKFSPGTSFKGRFLTDPAGSFAALINNKLVGIAYAPIWGSLALLGPVAVRPEHWGQGIGQQLLTRVMEYYSSQPISHAGLSTFPDVEHIPLYEKFGYRSRFLTAFMLKPITDHMASNEAHTWTRFSGQSAKEKAETLDGARHLTNIVYTGLDLSKELQVVDKLAIGDTVLLRNGVKLAGFAICHHGEGSEAESGECYIKFAAVQPGSSAPAQFGHLLSACTSLGQELRATKLRSGVNVARSEAYEAMLSLGFKIETFCVAMHKPNEPGYNHAGIFVIDDWR